MLIGAELVERRPSGASTDPDAALTSFAEAMNDPTAHVGDPVGETCRRGQTDERSIVEFPWHCGTRR
jgi:hypothetical protein